MASYESHYEVAAPQPDDPQGKRRRRRLSSFEKPITQSWFDRCLAVCPLTVEAKAKATARAAAAAAARAARATAEAQLAARVAEMYRPPSPGLVRSSKPAKKLSPARTGGVSF